MLTVLHYFKTISAINFGFSIRILSLKVIIVTVKITMLLFHYPFYKTQLEPAPNQKQMDLCMEEVSLAAGSSSTLSPIAHRPSTEGGPPV